MTFPKYRVFHKTVEPMSRAQPMKYRGSVLVEGAELYDYTFTPVSLGVEVKALSLKRRKQATFRAVESAIRTHYGQNAQRYRGRRKKATEPT